jgi:ABC-type branched-subunit amino acid transport system ATPase component
MYGHLLSNLGPSAFGVGSSIVTVQMAVVGGLGVLSGPLLGALFIGGVPHIPLDAAGVAATNFGLLLIIMYLPQGLSGLVQPVRDRVAWWIGRRSGIDSSRHEVDMPSPVAARDAAAVAKLRGGGATPTLAQPEGAVLLKAHGLAKRFGGVHAVRDVSLTVRAGETLGLIGPNGAGKTTTFELLGGFTKPDAGVVTFNGRDVTLFGPEARGRLGLIRSFQDAALFPTMTVLEAVQASLERVDRTRFLPSVLGVTTGERRKELVAREVLTFMGLEHYRDSQVRELSTGTRRITELACLVALQPTLLLLDEPSSGVAQRETEALGALLRRIKATLGTTLVVIEHDIPLIMDLADRLIVMAEGEVIAHGPPGIVRTDPAVIEAYLGGNLTAIERSGARNQNETTPRGATATATAGG